VQTTPIPAGHAERDAPNLKSHRTPHRSDSGKNFLVWSNSSRSQVVETFANCIEILLLDCQEVFKGLCHKVLAPPSGVLCKRVQRFNLRRFKSDLELF